MEKPENMDDHAGRENGGAFDVEQDMIVAHR
jgi:hypothetical protein